MKKIIVSLVALALSLSLANAQDLAQVTDIYNNGAALLGNGDKSGAFSSFEQAYKLATALGADGKEIADKCKEVLPSISLSMAKDLVEAASYDEAIKKLNAAIEVAKTYGNTDVQNEATGLIPQVLSTHGAALINAKKYAEAATVYKQILAADSKNGVAALRLGIALNGVGDLAGAKDAFTIAAENGQGATAKKQLSNIFLKDASAALKAKKYADAVAAAEKSIENSSNAQAYRVAGQASQLAGKNAEAIKFYEKFIELFPKDKNVGALAYTVGALYQTSKNNAKAIEFYTKALTDPTYGAEAKKMLDALK